MTLRDLMFNKIDTYECFYIDKKAVSHSKILLDTRCMTEDNFECQFPFKFGNHNYFTCSKEKTSNLPSGTRWCAIDTNDEGQFKSIGKCKNTYCRVGMHG